MKKWNLKNMVFVILLIAVILVSVLGAGKYATSAESYKKTIESLDEKRETVTKLTIASTAVSTLITALPGDIATPVAEKLADLSGYFMWIFCAIFLEKYSLTIIGFATFRILIPLGCILWIVNIFLKKEHLTKLIMKLLFFGMALFLVVPTSVAVSNSVEKIYNESIEMTLQSAQDTIDEIDEESEKATSDDGDKGFLSNLVDKVQTGIASTTEKITVRVKTSLKNFVEALAVMIVTTCIIPILVILFYIWLVKIVIGVNLDLKKLPKMPRANRLVQKKKMDDN